MNQHIPYQPVSFGPDINENPPCDCPQGRYYEQPVEYGDITRFQLPNPCTKTTAGSSELLTCGDFDCVDHFTPWEGFILQYGLFGAGASSCAFGSGYILQFTPQSDNYGPISDIVNQPVTITSGQRYRCTFDFSYCSGPGTDVRLLLVGFTSWTDSSTADYEILKELPVASGDTGSKDYSFIATKDYIRFGVAVKNGITDDIIEFDNISLKAYASAECLTVNLKDKDGNTIAVVPLTYYNEHVLGEVDWSDVDRYGSLQEGCYKICVEDSPFGENIITAGNDGTFELDYDGWQNDPGEPTWNVTQGVSDTFVYKGDKSLWVGVDQDLPASIILQTIDTYRLKPNTEYTLSAWVRLGIDPSGDYSGYVGDATINIGTDIAAGTITSQDGLICQTQQAAWKKIFITFTTGAVAKNPHIQIFIDSANLTPALSFISLFVDEVSLVDTSKVYSCSQVFNLRHSHGCRTTLLQYYNDNPAFGFIYPTAWKFAMRLKGWLGLTKWKDVQTDYENSAGEMDLIYASLRKNEILTINDAPDYIHDAVNLALHHQHFFIDAEEYVKVEGEYTPKPRTRSTLREAQAEVTKKIQLLRNRIE